MDKEIPSPTNKGKRKFVLDGSLEKFGGQLLFSCNIKKDDINC